MVEIAALPTAAGVLMAGCTVSRVMAGGAFACMAGSALHEAGMVHLSAGPGDPRAFMAISTVSGIVTGRPLGFMACGAA